ncbi:DUF5641 domain-containing protein [Trichonephila clavipes]|nr:DUF5641 domain-containing protein [Trichonephila clavipes]
MLNSRPLVPLSSDLDDLNVLTPSHFLIGRSITSIVEPDLTNLNENRLDNWQKITKIIQLIWKRWSVDYLNSLQQRNKWHFEKKNAKIGDMVIIKEDNLPPCQWSLGRINNIYPGKDSKNDSSFSLSSDCRRQLIWRESGTAYRPENIQEKDRYPTCSTMVWPGIMINGRTRLHVVANGTMTGQRYIDEVLLPHARLFRGAVGDKFVFMDDNATCHRTLAVQDCLDSEGIQRLVWPARSPDLNPIENVWDALGRQVAGRNYPPTNKNILIRALTEEWDKLPQ